VTRTALDAGRLAGKAGIAAGLPGSLTLPFFAADAHFVGHPVHLIVFDGDSEVKADVIDELHGIVMVTTAPPGDRAGVGDGALSDAHLVAECLAGRRVRWETIRHTTPPPTAPAPEMRP